MELCGLTWRKASYSTSGSTTQCVEVGVWRKASYSTSGNTTQCVEVGVGREAGCTGAARGGPGIVAVRDSKDPSGPVLTVKAGGWQAFTAQLKADVHILIRVRHPSLDQP